MDITRVQASVPFVLAIQNEAYRYHLASQMQKIGFNPEAVGSPGLIYQLTREQYAKSLVILDTEDDVAWLVQLVNDYHRSPFHMGGDAPIICLVSEQAMVTSPRLGWWLIDGSAAVLSVRIRETDFHLELLKLFRLLTKEPTPDTEPERLSYDALVTRVLQVPLEGQGMLDLGVRLAEWQNSHQARFEAARAFLRHAVMHLPESAEAHRHYGESLLRMQQAEGLFHLREAVRLAPDAAEGYLALGHSLVEVDRAEALKTLLKAVQIDPEGNSGKKARNVIATCRLEGA